MKDISLHILDILENSVKAGAGHVELHLMYTGTLLKLEISDDGPGFPDGADPSDPYFTSRTERPVGLGLSLLRQAAEQAGGGLSAGNRTEGGARVEVFLDMAHVDVQPLGDISGAVTTAILAWPAAELTVYIGPEKEEVLSTEALKAELEDVPLHHPAVQKFLNTRLNEELAALAQWADDVGNAMADTLRRQPGSDVDG